MATFSGANPSPAHCYAALPFPWHPPTYRGHFPQMSVEDRLIWNRWLDHHADDFECYAYNVPVGGLDCDDPDTPEAVKTQWRYCTAKRIDVLAWGRPAPTIFEVRYQAGVSALGALLTYGFLFREHNPQLPRPRLHLLTDHIAADTARAAEHYGLRLTVLPG